MRRGWHPLLAGVIILFSIPILAWANFRLAESVSDSKGILYEWTVRLGFLVEDSNDDTNDIEVAVERSFARYPLPTLLIRGVLGLLPYPAARAAWMTILSVALVAGIFLGFAAADWTPSFWMLALAAIVSLISYYAIRGIVEGQFAILQGVLILASLLAFHRNQDELAGLLFATTITDPWTMAILLPFILIYAGSKRRWALVMWASVGIAVIVVVSVLQDPGWPLRWVVSVVAPAEPSLAISLPARISASLFGGSMLVAWLLVLVLAIYMIWEWNQSISQELNRFMWAAALTMTIAAILIPSSSPSSYLILLPILTFVIGLAIHRWSTTGQIGGAIALVILLIVGWLFAISAFGEDLLLQLMLPLMAIVGLLWMRWWSIRAYRLPQ